MLLWGLVPLNGCNQEAKNNIGDRKNYTTKTQWTFELYNTWNIFAYDNQVLGSN